MTDYRWTLEEELCEIAGRHSLGESLKRLDLLGSLDESFKVVQRGEWVRGGGRNLSIEVCHLARLQTEY